MRSHPFAHIRHAKKRAFLIAFANTGHVGRAAAAAKIDRHMPALWRGNELSKMARDDEFADAYELAREMAGQTLEDEVIERGRDGWLKPLYSNGKRVLEPETNPDGTIRQELLLSVDGKPVFDENGKPVFREFWKPAFILEKSDTLLIFATKGANPARYRENISHRLVDGDGKDRSLLAEFDRFVEAADQAG